MLSYPDINEALRLGLHELVKMPDVKGTSFPMNVMVGRRSFVEKNRNLVKRFQQAYAEGTYQFITQKEKGLAVLSKAVEIPKIQKDSKKPTITLLKAFPCRRECRTRLAQHLGNHCAAKSGFENRHESRQIPRRKHRR